MRLKKLNIDHSYIQFAYSKEGERVSIFDVPTGKSCGCFCRICGEPLGAKNSGKTRDTILEPNQKVPHFYHQSGSTCKGETIIHILAKEVFLESKKLMLTIREVTHDEFHRNYDYRLVEFDEVILEEKIWFGERYIQPDAIGKVNGKTLLVEFAYSHPVGYEKEELLQVNKRACVEINLKVPYIDWSELQTEEDLKERITRFLHEDGFLHQSWIYNPKYPGGKKIMPKKEYNERNSYLEKLDLDSMKLGILKKAFRTNSDDFVREILNFEERSDLLNDDHFTEINGKISLTESSLIEITSLIKENHKDWEHIILSHIKQFGGHFDIPYYSRM